jgi:hypothetical protein
MTVMPTMTIARDTNNTNVRSTNRVTRTGDARLCRQRVRELGTDAEGSNVDGSRWSA